MYFGIQESFKLPPLLQLIQFGGVITSSIAGMTLRHILEAWDKTVTICTREQFPKRIFFQNNSIFLVIHIHKPSG